MALNYKISSRTRDDPTNSLNTDFIHSSRVVINARTITIKHITFPNLFANIRTGINDLFTYNQDDGGGPVLDEVEIPEGFYTAESLAAYITSQLTDITVTYSATTRRINIANGTLDDLNFFTTERSVFPAFGQVTNFSMTSSSNVDLTHEPNLFNHHNVYISSSKLSSGHNLITSGGKRLPILCAIPITSPYGGLETYKPSIEMIDTIVFEERQNINQVDIKIVDEEGRTLTLPPNHHVDILLHIVPT